MRISPVTSNQWSKTARLKPFFRCFFFFTINFTPHICKQDYKLCKSYKKLLENKKPYVALKVDKQRFSKRLLFKKENKDIF